MVRRLIGRMSGIQFFLALRVGSIYGVLVVVPATTRHHETPVCRDLFLHGFGGRKVAIGITINRWTL